MRMRAIVLLTIALLAAGCGPLPSEPPAPQPALAEPLTWPPPPQQPRIRFLRAVARPADLGIRPSFWQRLGEFLAGGREEWFVRPTGVAASGQAIYVADPGAQAMW
ncbi:MAG: hypothetical protein ACE5JS_14140, partial [Nitrospinota bacterium]